MINSVDEQYLALAERVITKGVQKGDRTGTGTMSVFGAQMRFDLSEGFPLLTTKRVPFRIVAQELLWFVKGSTDLKYLLDNNVHIWDDDAYRWYRDNHGRMNKEEFLKAVQLRGFELGDIYGAQWRNWNGENIDQLKDLIEQVKTNPDSRRMLMIAFNPSVLGKVALPPCHYAVQLYVAEGKLSLMFTMRSNDIFLGLPFNIASYALLVHIIAKMTGLEVGELVYSAGDAHVYLNHIEQVKEQLQREPRLLPKLTVKTVHENIEDYTIDDFELEGYDPHPTIKGKVSVGL
ncbi:thymidylate synthase [Bacillus phage vB_BceM_Bc431v3]|uniref:Thymidylate synthase n=1 Tax=Bacillus phage vB_BceM_Bc431v3 TaxID=1195072 RepID=M4HND3_9CAUD|nr:thymidylate synthase [Bacillus phage vB_BceM_Bc431v3]AFQ96329.1 thymidylate synthase [Bacillus phage vB_BceM_Bc431v3]